MGRTEAWDRAWKAGCSGFHLKKPHDLLVQHLEEITGRKQNLRFFVPFCGKSVDMILLLERGHRVVGLECSEEAIRQFQKENDALIGKLIKQPLRDNIDGCLYRTGDDRLHIYCCDMYEYSGDLGGRIDVIWERAALTSLKKAGRKKYADKIVSFMSPGCKYYVVQMIFTDNMPAPPYSLTDEHLQEIYGSRCDITLVDTRDALQDYPALVENVEKLDERLSLITLRHSNI